MHAASQLPGRGLTDVDEKSYYDDPVAVLHAFNSHISTGTNPSIHVLLMQYL